MRYFILSARNLVRMPSNGVAFELENLLVDVCNAELVCPVATEDRKHLTLPDLTRLDGDRDERVLLVVALSTPIAYIMSVMPQWRRDFGTAAAYVIDPWEAWSAWPERVPRTLDCFFVPDVRIADRFRSVHGVNASAVPLGADVLGYGSNALERPLDMVAYGRQNADYLRVFKERFNDPRSKRFLYHDTFSNARTSDFRDNRRLIWKLLHKSRIALSFDVLATPESRPGDRYRSIIPIRYYEAAAAGTAIVGRHPVVPEMPEQFGWADATIELPDTPGEALEFVEALLQDEARMRAIHARNHAEALARHDWRYRIRDMLAHLGLPLPERLRQALDVLAGACGAPNVVRVS